MDTFWSFRHWTDRLRFGGVLLSLLLCPFLAASQSTWPALVVVNFASTLGLVFLWLREAPTRSQVLWGALLLRLAFLPLLPGLSDDLYRYVWDGWVQMEGINPYHYTPQNEALSRFQSARLYEELNSPAYYSVYPPLTQVAFAVGGWLYTEFGWYAAYYGLKALFVTGEFGAVVLLSRMTAPKNVLLYAWNPLVLIETAGQGHTEALLIPCLVGLVWAVRRGRGQLASVLVAAAGLIKLYPFVLWPFLLRRHGWASVWPGIVFVGVVSLPYTASYTLPHLMASVELFARLFEFNAGPYYLTKYSFWAVTGADWSKQIGPAFRILFLGLLPLLYAWDFRRDWSIQRALRFTIGLFLVLSTTVHPWYVVPMLALGVMLPKPDWPWFWLGACSVGTYLFYAGGPYWIWVILGWGGAAIVALWHCGYLTVSQHTRTP